MMQHRATVLRHATTLPTAHFTTRITSLSRPSCRWNSTTTGARRAHRRVLTLDPSKLTLPDYLDLGGYKRAYVNMGTQPRTGTMLHYAATPHGIHIKFPPEARGYMYFDRADPCPHVASGSIKFRVAANDPDVQAAFAAGYNLCMPDGWQPWSTHLLALGRSALWKPVYDMLRAEGLVTSYQETRIEELLRNAPPVNQQTGVKYRLNSKTTMRTVLESFPIDFSHNDTRIVLLDPDEIRSVRLRNPMVSPALGESPFSGVGLVRFEASAAPIPASARLLNPPAVVLRFLEWLKPPTSDPPPETPIQVPGTLVKKLRLGGNWSEPWILDPKHLPEKSWAMLKARDLPPLT